jgi:hypothetical protein
LLPKATHFVAESDLFNSVGQRPTNAPEDVMPTLKGSHLTNLNATLSGSARMNDASSDDVATGY